WSFSLHVGVNQWDFSHLNLIVYQQRRPLRSTLFPYTTLFRSRNVGGAADRDGERAQKDQDHHRSGHHVPHGRPRQLPAGAASLRSEEHTSELQSRENLVCRLLLEKKNRKPTLTTSIIQMLMLP